MLIAKIQNEKVVTVEDYRSLFPNTSFPPTGPSTDFLEEMGCMVVTVWKTHDQSTQKLIPADPYIIDNMVYTVKVVNLTPEDLAEKELSKKAANKSQAETLLQQTDWTTIPDVSDPALSNPYLTNAAEFAAYRSDVRKIAVNPPVTVEVWPVKPDTVWSEL